MTKPKAEKHLTNDPAIKTAEAAKAEAMALIAAAIPVPMSRVAPLYAAAELLAEAVDGVLADPTAETLTYLEACREIYTEALAEFLPPQSEAA